MPFKIGQVAKVSGMGIETIRFYERNGLIEKPNRKASGYREYSQEIIPHLRFIKRAKELGFSLREISEILSMRKRGQAKCKDVRVRAEQKLSDIEAKIRDLQKMRKALWECPILHSLED